ncbi:hypothetical protein EV121DRAFT_194257 [Schizophyllum commune]
MLRALCSLGLLFKPLLGKRQREPEPEEKVATENPSLTAESELVSAEVSTFPDEAIGVTRCKGAEPVTTEAQEPEESPRKKLRLETTVPAPKPKVVDWRTKPLAPVPYKLKNGSKKYTQFRKEERGGPFIAMCPSSVRQTYDTMVKQANDMCVLASWTPEGMTLAREYHVLGHSGKVYTTHIGRKLHCNCPHFFKGNHCKHIIYIFIKFLRLPVSSYIWYQRALTRREVCNTFANAPKISSNATFQALAAYLWAFYVDDQNASKPDFDEICTICCNVPEEPKSELKFCEGCRKALHKECFYLLVKEAVRIAKVKNFANPIQTLTCPHCRRRWHGPVELEGLVEEGDLKQVAKIKVTKEGFTQLADVLGRKLTGRGLHYIAKRNAKYRRRWLDQQYYLGNARGPKPQIARSHQLQLHIARRREEELRRREVIASAQEAAAKVNVLSMQPSAMRRKKSLRQHAYNVSQAAEKKARLELLATYQAGLVSASSTSANMGHVGQSAYVNAVAKTSAPADVDVTV